MEQSWTSMEHPEGFALDTPAGWETSAEAGRIDAAGANFERVTIMPFKLGTQLDANGARDILLAISRQFWPQQRWEMPRGGWQFNVSGVGAVGADEGALRQTAALWWANTAEGATAFFYALAAPPARFKSLEPVFARILSSFRVTRAGQPVASNPLAGMQFQRWIDPMENAFSIEVPVGWHVTGGVFRPNMVSMSEFVLRSPDGQVFVRSGDVNFPSKYITPNMTLMSLGTWEGQYTSDGTLVMNHKTGLDFAVYYLQNTVGRNCRNLQWLNSRDRADRIQALGWYTQMLGYTMHTAGEVMFSCDFGGPAYLGYQYAETAITHNSYVATLWNPQALFGFLATPEHVRLADAVLFHAITTFQTNPQWMMRQSQMNHQIAEQNRRYNEYSNQLWQQTQAERLASWDRIAEQRGDILRGHTRVVDPETRQAYKVESGSNYYWIDPVNNVIAGTNTPYMPTWNYHEMIQTYH